MTAPSPGRTIEVLAAEPGGVPIHNWAGQVEADTISQARNMALLPFAVDHVALMPDAHPGYAMPVGGVFMGLGAVVPYAVGVDIGCGVRILYPQATVDDLKPGDLDRILEGVAARVPVGNGPQAEHQDPAAGWSWLGDAGGQAGYLVGILEYARKQLGTLGGGNHFLELQRDEAGKLYFMLHSGSRSVGKKLCDHHVKVAQGIRSGSDSEALRRDPNLAWLEVDTDEGQAYLSDMHLAMAWAEENRRRMALGVVEAITDVLGVEVEMGVDVHHNYASLETHYGIEGWVHRKGAVHAGAGDQVLIPGSMGTASYIARGLGSVESFESCQHGAGRARSRGATRRMTNLAEMDRQLGEVRLVTPVREKVIDESPVAYKDIEDVMARSLGLVEAAQRLTPLGVVKG